MGTVSLAACGVGGFMLLLSFQACGNEVAPPTDAGRSQSDTLSAVDNGPARIRPGDVMFDANESVVATSLLRSPAFGVGKGMYPRSIQLSLSIDNGAEKTLKLSGVFKPSGGKAVHVPLARCSSSRVLPTTIEPGVNAEGEICFLLPNAGGDLIIPGEYLGYAVSVSASTE